MRISERGMRFWAFYGDVEFRPMISDLIFCFAVFFGGESRRGTVCVWELLMNIFFRHFQDDTIRVCVMNGFGLFSVAYSWINLMPARK